MNYKFNDNTLLHAVAFNPFKLESILQNSAFLYKNTISDRIIVQVDLIYKN